MTHYQRILITGGEGMLGRSFTKICQQEFPDARIMNPGRKDLDVTDPGIVNKTGAGFNPDLIIHCAGLVNAELCETEPALAKTVIYDGTKNMVDLAARIGSRFVYPQSFLIYDGKELPITEETIPHPSFVYGFEKLRAEQYAAANLKDALIIIMAGFFGGYEKDKNFVGKIIPVLLKAVKNRSREIEIGDRIWQPTSTDDLAANTILLVKKGKLTRYCMSSIGEASFADLAAEIIGCLGLSNYLKVKVVSSSQVSGKERAKRPDRAVMSNSAMEKEGLCIMRDWRVSLREYLTDPFFQNQAKEILQEIP